MLKKDVVFIVRSSIAAMRRCGAAGTDNSHYHSVRGSQRARRRGCAVGRTGCAATGYVARKRSFADTSRWCGVRQESGVRMPCPRLVMLWAITVTVAMRSARGGYLATTRTPPPRRERQCLLGALLFLPYETQLTNDFAAPV